MTKQALALQAVRQRKRSSERRAKRQHQARTRRAAHHAHLDRLTWTVWRAAKIVRHPSTWKVVIALDREAVEVLGLPEFLEWPSHLDTRATVRAAIESRFPHPSPEGEAP